MRCREREPKGKQEGISPHAILISCPCLLVAWSMAWLCKSETCNGPLQITPQLLFLTLHLRGPFLIELLTSNNLKQPHEPLLPRTYCDRHV